MQTQKTLSDRGRVLQCRMIGWARSMLGWSERITTKPDGSVLVHHQYIYAQLTLHWRQAQPSRHPTPTNPSPLKASHLTHTSAIPQPESPPRLLRCAVPVLTVPDEIKRRRLPLASEPQHLGYGFTTSSPLNTDGVPNGLCWSTVYQRIWCDPPVFG